MIYRAAKVQKNISSCKRLQSNLLKNHFLYVLQHKTWVRYCAREKKYVPLQATFGVE